MNADLFNKFLQTFQESQISLVNIISSLSDRMNGQTQDTNEVSNKLQFKNYNQKN